MFKRLMVCTLGMVFLGFGVAASKIGGLGISPISSVANVMSLKFTFLSLGGWVIAWNFVLIIMQIAIRKRNFELYQFLQVPLSFVFGYFTDVGLKLFAFTQSDIYVLKFLNVMLGTLFMGIGISLCIAADVIYNSGEAIVKAIAEAVKKPFGITKIVFDSCCALTSIILSLIFFDMKLLGVREGTLFTAACVGNIVRLLSGPTGKLANYLRGTSGDDN